MTENKQQPSFLINYFLPFLPPVLGPPTITTLAPAYFLVQNPRAHENPTSSKNRNRAPRRHQHLQSPREPTRSFRRRTHGRRQGFARTRPAKFACEVVARARSSRSGCATERIRPRTIV